jgi:NADPH2:quinone reductase
MKAILCKVHGDPETLVLEDVPSHKAGPGQVVVDVKAAGVNFPDTLIIRNLYQFKPPLPFSPGSEIAGVVKEVGDKVGHVKPGDRVVGMAGWGGFAEEIVMDGGRVFPMPPGLDFPLASALTLAYGTTYHALKDRGALKAGETLLVLGAAGGTGLSAVEIGKAMGARVIAATSSDEKCAVCREHGADAVINYAKQDLREALKTLTEGKGPDVVYDPVGGPYAEPALRSLGWRGRYLVIGFTAGDIPKIPLNIPLLKGNSVVGVFWGEFNRREPKAAMTAIGELLGLIQSGKIKPKVTASYPLAKAPQALRDMMERRVTGKVVVLPEA